MRKLIPVSMIMEIRIGFAVLTSPLLTAKDEVSERIKRSPKRKQGVGLSGAGATTCRRTTIRP